MWLTGPQGLPASSVQPSASSESAAASQYVGSVELQPSMATDDPTSVYPSSQYSVYQQPTAYQHYTGLLHFVTDHFSCSGRGTGRVCICASGQ